MGRLKKTDMVKDMPVQVKIELGLVKQKAIYESQKKASKNYINKKKQQGFSVFTTLCSPELRADINLIKSDNNISSERELLVFLTDFYAQHKGR